MKSKLTSISTIERKAGLKTRTLNSCSSSRTKVRAPQSSPAAIKLDNSSTMRILVPIDFSDCSRAALRYAVQTAARLEAALFLLYVAETNPAGWQFEPRHLPDLEADLRHLAREKLAQLIKEEIPDATASEALIRAGRPDAEILEVAKRLKVELIVMATHSNDSHQGQLGTTAGRVASLATCPVLLVPLKEACVPFFL